MSPTRASFTVLNRFLRNTFNSSSCATWPLYINLHHTCCCLLRNFVFIQYCQVVANYLTVILAMIADGIVLGTLPQNRMLQEIEWKLL
jgi:hypothetical protein